MKYFFKNDYSEGCHPSILKALSNVNDLQQNGYGEDDFCKNAERRIQVACNNPNAKVHFVSGGTFANLLVIAALLKPYESVISAETGHINSNETGAIEYTGHKINYIASQDGKLSPSIIIPILENHTNFPHQVKPKLVYISNATELGTIYSKSELIELSQFCKEKDLLLFMDGARVGHAITSDNSDLTLEDISNLTDVFYIGGTKNGAMFGEAIVVNNPQILDDLRFHMKQKGGMLAKGRFLGIQFNELFTDHLFFELAKHANSQAQKLKNEFLLNGFELLTDTFTNQIFPILNNSQIDILSEYYEFYIWKKIDENNSAIRLVTSWAAEEDVVNEFCDRIRKL